MGKFLVIVTIVMRKIIIAARSKLLSNLAECII